MALLPFPFTHLATLVLLFSSSGVGFPSQQLPGKHHATQSAQIKTTIYTYNITEQSVDCTTNIQQGCLDSCKCGYRLPFMPPALTRRSAIGAIASYSTVAATTTATALPLQRSATNEVAVDKTISDTTLSDLKYKNILGKGAYKTVYLVEDTKSATQWALAVQKVRSKADARNGLKGIRMAEELQSLLAKTKECGDCFEKVERWWFQSTPLPEFAPNIQVFPAGEERTQTIPHKFLGHSKWLVALKPLYDMDLKRFAEKSPTLYPIGSTPDSNTSRILAGLDLNERDNSAIGLACAMCEAGRLMHSCSLVHRDIKPKNIMLKGGQPVIIDFGFAEFVERRRSNRLCIEEPGKMKGEAGYMLSNDAANYQGCAEGDTYAMGKTLYQVVFGAGAKDEEASTDSSSSSSSSSSSGSSSSSSATKMTLEKIKTQEMKFRKLLSSGRAGTKSRFLLTDHGRETLMLVIRGLCQKQDSVSFSEATEYLKNEISIV